MEFPIEFNECPICHCQETVCREACADEPSVPNDVFVSLEKVFTPIQQPGQLLGLLVKGIMTHFDICAKCGTRYCTKAEIVSMPLTVQQASGQNKPPFRRG